MHPQVIYFSMRMCLHLEPVGIVVQQMCMAKHSLQFLVHLHHKFSLSTNSFILKGLVGISWGNFRFHGKND